MPGTYPPATAPHPDEEADEDLKASATSAGRRRLVISLVIFLIFLAAAIAALLLTVKPILSTEKYFIAQIYLLNGSPEVALYSRVEANTYSDEYGNYARKNSLTHLTTAGPIRKIEAWETGPPYKVSNGHQGGPEHNEEAVHELDDQTTPCLPSETQICPEPGNITLR